MQFGFCKVIQDFLGNDPAYCNNDISQIYSGDAGSSLGIMQINTKVHTDANVADIDANINYGLNLLVQGYNSSSKAYGCHPQIDGSFVKIFYSGWERSLRNYNGWNTDCTKGNPLYVEEVKDAKTDVAVIFPECA